MKQKIFFILLLLFSLNLWADKKNDYFILLVKSWSYETLVKHIKNNDIDVNYQDKNGYTGLMYAAQDGYLDKIRLLIKIGADVNLVSPTGYTALQGAVSFGHPRVVKILIKARPVEKAHP